ncbi:MAG TPA: DUF2071 domain-containing protein [Acidobacteriaceae bacterium]|jgi:hypothetical protein
MPSTFLTAEWRKLIMVQYAVPEALLTPYIPRGLEMDLFQNQCYVSLVGFLFDRVRVKGAAIPFHMQFEEINLRFYVRRREADGSMKRGVVFVREFVPRWAIATIARLLYEEPYQAIPTRHAISSSGAGLHAEYRWKLGGRWHGLSAGSAILRPKEIEPGSEEEFVTEHYFGYTKRSDGSTSEYGVEHPRWQVYPVANFNVDADMGMLYGPEFSFLNDAPVASVLLAEGSAVRVLGGKRLD